MKEKAAINFLNKSILDAANTVVYIFVCGRLLKGIKAIVIMIIYTINSCIFTYSVIISLIISPLQSRGCEKGLNVNSFLFLDG